MTSQTTLAELSQKHFLQIQRTRLVAQGRAAGQRASQQRDLEHWLRERSSSLPPEHFNSAAPSNKPRTKPQHLVTSSPEATPKDDEMPTCPHLGCYLRKWPLNRLTTAIPSKTTWPSYQGLDFSPGVPNAAGGLSAQTKVLQK